jgi:hypothetical protein
LLHFIPAPVFFSTQRFFGCLPFKFCVVNLLPKTVLLLILQIFHSVLRMVIALFLFLLAFAAIPVVDATVLPYVCCCYCCCCSSWLSSCCISVNFPVPVPLSITCSADFMPILYVTTVSQYLYTQVYQRLTLTHAVYSYIQNIKYLGASMHRNVSDRYILIRFTNYAESYLISLLSYSEILIEKKISKICCMSFDNH